MQDECFPVSEQHAPARKGLRGDGAIGRGRLRAAVACSPALRAARARCDAWKWTRLASQSDGDAATSAS